MSFRTEDRLQSRSSCLFKNHKSHKLSIAITTVEHLNGSSAAERRSAGSSQGLFALSGNAALLQKSMVGTFLMKPQRNSFAVMVYIEKKHGLGGLKCFYINGILKPRLYYRLLLAKLCWSRV